MGKTKDVVIRLHADYPRDLPLGKLRDCIRGLDKNADWDITISRRVQHRTQAQNAIFHAICRDIANHSGEEEWRVKELMKARFGIRIKDTLEDGTNVEYLKPTAEYEAEEMTALLDRLIPWADEFGADMASHRHDHAEWKRGQKK